MHFDPLAEPRVQLIIKLLDPVIGKYNTGMHCVSGNTPLQMQ